MMTVNQMQADIRRMEKFICERIPPDGPTRIVIEPGWVDLTAFWDDYGDCDLHIESVGPYPIGLRDVYRHFRRQEMTGWEKERELASEMNRWKVWDLERELAVLSERDRKGEPASEVQGNADCMTTVDENGLPREVSTAKAAMILGVSKDTVLRLKDAGLLEYRRTGTPDSCRPVFAFTLRSVLKLRTSYEQDIPMPRRPKESPRRRVKGERKYEHLRLTPD